MTQIATNYAIILYDMGVKKETIEETKRIFTQTPQLMKSLKSPIVSKDDKHRVINRIFPVSMKQVLKVMCDKGSIAEFDNVYEAYEAYCNERNGILKVRLYCVTPPTQSQLLSIKKQLSKQHHKSTVLIDEIQAPELLGGFLLRFEDYEIDWSMKGRLKQLQQKLVRR